MAWLGAGLGGAHLLAYAAGSARAAVLFTNPNVSAAVLVGIVPLSLYLEARRDQVIAAALCLRGTGCNGFKRRMLAVALNGRSLRDLAAWRSAVAGCALALAVDGAFRRATE